MLNSVCPNCLRTGMALVVLILGVTASVAAPESLISVSQAEYHGVLLAAVPPKAGEKFDTRVVGPKAALKKMLASLAQIRERSPSNWRDIERLKENGPVVLLYAPGMLEKQVTHNVAVFIPDFQDEASGGSAGNSKRDFITVRSKYRIDLGGAQGKLFLSAVGRHGIKWPATELAVVLVHEFGGHGIQHLKGEIGRLRSLDIECEAYMKTEQAFKDLKFRKLHDTRVHLRMAMDRRFCVGFKSYLRTSHSVGWKEWNGRRFHVPTLLAAYEKYTDHLVKSGAVARANRAIKKRQTKVHARLRKEKKLTPEEAFQFANKLWAGNLTVKQNRPEAVRWYRFAASGGNAVAQYLMGELHILGTEVSTDSEKAVRYFRAAANQGHVPAQFRLGRLYAEGGHVKTNLIEAYAWLCQAARNKHEKAAEMKFELAVEMHPADVRKGKALARKYASGK